jgi:hypothetical protein
MIAEQWSAKSAAGGQFQVLTQRFPGQTCQIIKRNHESRSTVLKPEPSEYEARAVDSDVQYFWYKH